MNNSNWFKKIINVVLGANRKICVALLLYIVDERGSSYTQNLLFAREKEDYKTQRIVFFKYKLHYFNHRVDVDMFDKQSVWNVFSKIMPYLFFNNCLFVWIKMSWNIGDKWNFFFKLKSIFGLYHVVLTTPEATAERNKVTLFEKQKIPEIEKNIPKNRLLFERDILQI